MLLVRRRLILEHMEAKIDFIKFNNNGKSNSVLQINFSIFILFSFCFDILSSNYFSIWQWQVGPTVLFHHQIWQGSSWNVVCKSSNFILWAFYCLFYAQVPVQYPLYLLSQAIVHVLCYETNISIYLKFASLWCFTMSVYRSPKSSYQKLFLTH